MDRAHERIRASRQRGDVIDLRRDASDGLTAPGVAAAAVLEGDSCGVPGSLLSKASLNGLSAGPSMVFSMNSMPWAVSFTSPVTGSLGGGPPDGGGAPDAGGDPDGAGEPDAPGAPPLAEPGGSRPVWSRTPATKMTARTLSSSEGVRGAGSGSRCPSCRPRPRCVLLQRIDQPADEGQDEGHDPAEQEPAAEDQAGHEHRHPIAPRMGRNDGPGMCTPGGGPVWTSAGSAGAVGPTSWS